MLRAKKFSIILLLCLAILVFGACSKNDEEKKEAGSGESTTPTAEVTPTEEAAPTEEVTPTLEATPTEEVTPTVEVTPTEEITPTEEPQPDMDSVKEGPGGAEVISYGTEVSEMPVMSDVFEAYYEYVRSCMDEEFTKFNTMRFGLAFIDNDILPELLVVDDNNHGSQVKVIFYNNGNPKEVGQFGSNGGFSYVKYENRIISFFMGGGAMTTSINHVNADLTVTVENDFYEDDNGVFKVNDQEVDLGMEAFEKLVDEARESVNGNKRILVDYENMLPYHPYVCDHDLIDAFDMMYGELLDPEYEAFSGYFNENMRKMEGVWTLINSNVTTGDDNFAFYVEDGACSGGNYETYSGVTVSKESGVGFWLSTYKDGESYNPLVLTQYAMKMIYFASGISDGLDYGWSVKAVPEFDDFEWIPYMCMDDEDHLIIALYKEREGETDEYGYPLNDIVTLTYKKEASDADQVSIRAELTRKEAYDVDDMMAFEAREYIIVNADDVELIGEYNLPEDLNGYDYEITYAKHDPYIIYLDQNTDVTVLDFSDGLDFKEESVTDFCKRSSFGAYVLYFNGYSPDGDFNGQTAVKVIEDYTG